jgi:DnaJ-class molecular chaperone
MTRTISGERDYYALLGVPYTASFKEITRAYREAMKTAHPDRQRPERRAAAEERAKLLNRAFTTLSHVESRRAYDREIKATAIQDQIMTRYAGGLTVPNGAADPFAEALRRPKTKAERLEQRRADRSATVNLFVVFAAIAGLVVTLLLLTAVVGFVLDHLI